MLRPWRLLLVGLAALLLGACAVPQLRPAVDARQAMSHPERLLLVTVSNPVGAGLHGAGSTWRGWDLGGAYEAGLDVQGTVSELARRYQLSLVDGWPIALLGVHCVVFHIDGSEPRDALIQRLAADPQVESVQALQQFRTAGALSAAPPPELQYSVKALGLTPAHRWAQGRGVRVAIVDTGVDFSHPELAGRVVRHLDLVGQGSDESFETERHGTAVAGVIAAADDGRGVLGVAPQAELLALKACWPVAAGAAAAECNSFTLARALTAAVELKADVLNLSLAGPPDPLLARLLERALARGILVIGALPEGRGREAAASFPAAVRGVIAVRSLGPADREGQALLAPGEDIISTAPGAGYALQSGSSFAAAHVSGIAALLRELDRGLSPDALARVLAQSSLRPASAPADDAPSVNACAAMQTLLGPGTCSAPL